MHLLESGRYGVTEVAARVGYDNPSAFAAAFRAQFGMPPSRARAVPARRCSPRTASRRAGARRCAGRAAEIDVCAKARPRRGGTVAACVLALLRSPGLPRSPPRAPRPAPPPRRRSTRRRRRRARADAAARRRRQRPAELARAGALPRDPRSLPQRRSRATTTRPGCFDPAAPQRLHGGDFAGLASTSTTSRTSARPPSGSRRRTSRPVRRAPRAATTATGSTTPIPPTTRSSRASARRDELAALVDAMHARRACGSCSTWSSTTPATPRGIPQQHPDWFHDPATCAQLGSPDVYCPLDHHPDFAQEQPEVAAYLSALEARAVTRYHLDGIRMDTAKHVPPSYFHDSFFPAVRAVHAGLFSIAEIFDESRPRRSVPYLDAGFDTRVPLPALRRARRGAIGAGRLDRSSIAHAVADGIARARPARALDLVLFVDNHDVPRFANVPGYGVPEDEIRRRLLLALDLIFTLPGIPQLYYGDELGMYGGGDPDNRRDLPAWATIPGARAAAPRRRDRRLRRRVRARAEARDARTTVPALADGAYHELWRQNGAANPNVSRSRAAPAPTCGRRGRQRRARARARCASRCTASPTARCSSTSSATARRRSSRSPAARSRSTCRRGPPRSTVLRHEAPRPARPARRLSRRARARRRRRRAGCRRPAVPADARRALGWRAASTSSVASTRATRIELWIYAAPTGAGRAARRDDPRRRRRVDARACRRASCRRRSTTAIACGARTGRTTRRGQPGSDAGWITDVDATATG